MDPEHIWALSSSMVFTGKSILNFRGDRLVVELEEDFTAYYRKLLGFRQYILKPSFGSHISVCRGVDASRYHGQEVEFQYSHLIRLSGDTRVDEKVKPDTYYFLDVWSDQIKQIRTELGLPNYHKFHITIGRIHYRS
jgi:predicted esterase YcpF (UPF0227 family)